MTRADEQIATDRFRGVRTLVTGGLGFIGSNLARRLADLGAHVTVLDNLLEGHGGNVFNLAGYTDRIAIVQGDVTDAAEVGPLLDGVSYVFHLAAQTGHAASMSDPIRDLNANVGTTLALLEACRARSPGAHVVFTSTRQVYGTPQFLPVAETHPIAPPDANGISKYAAEEYCRLYSAVHGLSTTRLRLTNTYGPRMRIRDARQMFLGVWIRRVLEGQPLDVFGDGRQRRDLNHVDDVVRALIASADRRHAGACFNLGADAAVSLADLAATLIAASEESGTWRLVPFPPERKAIDIGDYQGDYRKFAATSGWRPTVMLAAGLADTVRYYREHGREYL